MAGTGRAAAERFLAESRSWADAQLERLLPPAGASPPRLHEAMRYAVFGAGKRLRPALLRLVCLELGGVDEDAALPAAAIECVHTYSLVHDDLPCMDDDDLRRGRPTVHKAYGEALAVLAGDGLLTHAFLLLSRCAGKAGEMTAVLAEAAGPAGMVGGQALDLEVGLEGGGEARAGQAGAVESVHALKTAALLGAAAELGALAAHARPAARAAARAYGQALGRCFQAVDDILDVTGDASTLGKTPGKDRAAGKATLVAALGVEGARARARTLAAQAREAASALGPGPGSVAGALVDLLLERQA